MGELRAACPPLSLHVLLLSGAALRWECGKDRQDRSPAEGETQTAGVQAGFLEEAATESAVEALRIWHLVEVPSHTRSLLGTFQQRLCLPPAPAQGSWELRRREALCSLVGPCLQRPCHLATLWGVPTPSSRTRPQGQAQSPSLGAMGSGLHFPSSHRPQPRSPHLSTVGLVGLHPCAQYGSDHS